MKPLNFRIQRISRMEFWITWAVWNALSIAVLFVMGMEYQNYNESKMNLLFGIVLAVHFIYLFLLILKRFHDAGLSTGYCVLCYLLIPVVIGGILLFIACIKESDDDNRWGAKEEKLMYDKSCISKELFGK